MKKLDKVQESIRKLPREEQNQLREWMVREAHAVYEATPVSKPPVARARFPAEQVPLATDAQGVIRVGGTRVTLESIVDAFESGASAEEIAHQFPSLNLADIYAALGYYLHHRTECAAYLNRQRTAVEERRQVVEKNGSWRELRERLIACRR